MRPAIIYNDEEVFIEIEPDKFIDLLIKKMGFTKRSKTYTKLVESMQEIVSDLKEQTKYG